jgi:hypothetical protein
MKGSITIGVKGGGEGGVPYCLLPSKLKDRLLCMEFDLEHVLEP